MLLILLYLVYTAQGTLLQEVNCDTNLTVGSRDVTESDAILTHDASQITFSFKMTSTEYLNNVYLDLLTDSLAVSALNAADVEVGTALNWTTIQSAVKVPPGKYPGCITTPGCDGFILDTVKLLRLFPQTAVKFIFAGKKAQWSKNSTTILSLSSRRLLANAPSDAEIIGQSEPITTTMKFAPIWSTAAFGASPVDTNFKTITASVLGAIGFLMLVAILYAVWNQPKDGDGHGKSKTAASTRVSGGYYN
jgi:hypothetical protein